jgi:hypothetical protein
MGRDFTAPFNLLDFALRLIDCAELQIYGVREYPLQAAVQEAITSGDRLSRLGLFMDFINCFGNFACSDSPVLMRSIPFETHGGYVLSSTDASQMQKT